MPTSHCSSAQDPINGIGWKYHDQDTGTSRAAWASSACRRSGPRARWTPFRNRRVTGAPVEPPPVAPPFVPRARSTSRRVATGTPFTCSRIVPDTTVPCWCTLLPGTT